MAVMGASVPWRPWPDPDRRRHRRFHRSGRTGGMINALGGEVPRLACTTSSSGVMPGSNPVSREHLRRPTVPTRVPGQTVRAGHGRRYPAGAAEFEIPDTPAVWRDEFVSKALQRLHDLGFRVGIDGRGRAQRSDVVEARRSGLREDRPGVRGGHRGQPRGPGDRQSGHPGGATRRVIASGVETSAQLEGPAGAGRRCAAGQTTS